MKSRRAIFTTAPKGGVGKTYLAKLLYDLLPVNHRTAAAWDLDAATGTFAIYDDGIKTFDLNEGHNSSSWLDDCYREDVDDVLVDVPGGRIDDLLRTFGDDSVDALVSAVLDAGREFVVINPIGVMIAETVTAQVTLKAFASTNARTIVVKNGRFGAADDFVVYDGMKDDAGGRRYGTTGQMADAARAETLYLPALAPRLLAQLDAEQLRFLEASGPEGISRLGRLGAARVKMYLASVTQALRGSSLDLTGVIPQRRAES